METSSRPPTPPAAGPAPLTRLFMGRTEVRAFWRLLLYLAMVFLIGSAIRFVVMNVSALRGAAGQVGGMTPISTIIGELVTFLAVFLPALVMGRLERRPAGVYGLPRQGAFGRDFWAGMLWGLVLVSAVIGGIALFHGYDISGLAIAGAAILEYGLLWLVGFVLVGLFEEFSFRGYTQFTLASGIGFWPAAVVLSLAFGGAHLGNPGEGLVGALQVFLIAMFFCLTLRRTGSLWFAVGVHASFDWGETYLYSVPNSGNLATGHLFASALHGDKWLTGGTVGPEGSVICFVLVLIAIALFAWRYPRRTAPAAGAM